MVRPASYYDVGGAFSKHSFVTNPPPPIIDPSIDPHAIFMSDSWSLANLPGDADYHCLGSSNLKYSGASVHAPTRLHPMEAADLTDTMSRGVDRLQVTAHAHPFVLCVLRYILHEIVRIRPGTRRQRISFDPNY
jgi:hypothetical protein